MILRIIVLLFAGTAASFAQTPLPSITVKDKIDRTLNLWHHAAAIADFEAYFDLMTDDAVFIGTDPTENWQNNAFKTYSRPHFDKGKAWKFLKLERNIYVNDSKNFAWFDELLDTQMGICRGSGILHKNQFGWKIKHYVLSITIPNANVKEVKTLKASFDSNLKTRLKQ